jgi:hypothetical protein
MRTPLLSIAAIAAITHEANAAYCRTLGDTSQVAWTDAPDWQKDSAIAGVTGILDGTIRTPEQSHQSWMNKKIADGWTFGPVKDEVAKTHPCMVPYRELSIEQRRKDALFFSTVNALSVQAGGDRFEEPGQMHHADGWYFKRMDDGALRIQVRSGGVHENVDKEHLIPAAEWVSIIAEMGSPFNSGAVRFDMALRLHTPEEL